MQGLPFDDAEFPSPNPPVSSAWIEHSPRVSLVPPTHPSVQPPPVTDDELYRLVVAPPLPSSSSPPPHHQPPHHQPPPLSSIRYSQQQQIAVSTASQLHAFSQHPQSIPTQLPHAHPQSHPHPLAQPPSRQQLRRTYPASAIPAQTAIRTHAVQPDPPPHQLHDPSTTHTSLRGSSPLDGTRKSPASGLGTSGSPKRPTRSAVEEARLRAQREAESFAISRRDPTKREAALHISSPLVADGVSIEHVVSTPTPTLKRGRVDPEPASSNEYAPPSKKVSAEREDITAGRMEDTNEAEKQERYKRRLDMNRESAAVSRVRRRAYVKELEERLAVVEAEKLQLEGKLEIMLSQNESLKKQLEKLFMMVASGRRPSYSGVEVGAGTETGTGDGRGSGGPGMSPQSQGHAGTDAR